MNLFEIVRSKLFHKFTDASHPYSQPHEHFLTCFLHHRSHPVCLKLSAVGQKFVSYELGLSDTIVRHLLLLDHLLLPGYSWENKAANTQKPLRKSCTIYPLQQFEESLYQTSGWFIYKKVAEAIFDVRHINVCESFRVCLSLLGLNYDWTEPVHNHLKSTLMDVLHIIC